MIQLIGLSQSFATRVENVNPFHIVEYNGLIDLSPNTDTWVRTIQFHLEQKQEQ